MDHANQAHHFLNAKHPNVLSFKHHHLPLSSSLPRVLDAMHTLITYSNISMPSVLFQIEGFSPMRSTKKYMMYLSPSLRYGFLPHNDSTTDVIIGTACFLLISYFTLLCVIRSNSDVCNFFFKWANSPTSLAKISK